MPFYIIFCYLTRDVIEDDDDGYKFKTLWLLEVQICEKLKTRCPTFFSEQLKFLKFKKGNYFH